MTKKIWRVRLDTLDEDRKKKAFQYMRDNDPDIYEGMISVVKVFGKPEGVIYERQHNESE